MKAVIYEQYGPPEVLKLREVSRPNPKPNEVLIKVYAASVTTGDCNIRGFTYVPPGFGIIPRLMFGYKKPKKQILGTEISGVIEEVGNAVSQFKPGDEVFGIGSVSLGAYAEYVCRPESSALVLKPSTISHEEAATISFGGLTALYFLQKASIKPACKVLIRGASGGVGMFATQLARHFGAEVTGMCSNDKMEFVRSLGATQVLDYKSYEFNSQSQKYDIIMDTVVGMNSFCHMRNYLNPGGKYLAVAGGPREMFQMAITSVFGSKKVIFGSPPERKTELHFLADLAAKGQLRVPVNRIFDLEETAHAHRYFESGTKKGTVVIRVRSHNNM
jgi:NADPH:quinone reductase-like Zn-dependent oxidoreductase